MPDKQKPQEPNSPKPGTRRGIRHPDARNDPEKLRDNQQSLGVGPDHKTPDMKKGHRGTFP